MARSFCFSDQAGLVLGDALAPAPVLARRVGSLVRRTVRPAAERLADTPAHLVFGSDLVHAVAQRTKGSAFVTCDDALELRG